MLLSKALELFLEHGIAVVFKCILLSARKIFDELCCQWQAIGLHHVCKLHLFHFQLGIHNLHFEKLQDFHFNLDLLLTAHCIFVIVFPS